MRIAGLLSRGAVAVALFVGLATLVAPATLHAAGPLPGDFVAMPAWQGSVNYTGFFDLGATVEYAVYAPGAYGSAGPLFGAVDPSGGAHFVYAYQVFSTSALGGSVTNLTVGFSDIGSSPDLELPANIGIIAGPVFGTTDPSSSQFTPAGTPKTSAVWSFQGLSEMPLGDSSNILIYTSPFGPEWDASTVFAGSGDFQTLGLSLPSPVPEPSTVILLACGAFSMLAGRFWLHRRGRAH